MNIHMHAIGAVALFGDITAEGLFQGRYVCIFEYIHKCINMYIYIHVHTNMVFMKYMHMYIYVYMYLSCIYLYMYIYIQCLWRI
jgi:hypothetical protein